MAERAEFLVAPEQLRYKIHKNYGFELPIYRVLSCPQGCTCPRHPWVKSAEERGMKPEVPKFNDIWDLQQFTTPLNVAKRIVGTVSELCNGKAESFTEFGAGQGTISASFLMEGFVGVGVELDRSADCFSLANLDVNGRTPPYKCINQDVKEYSREYYEGGFIYTDLLFTNPPFKKINHFLRSAMECSDLIFALIPDDKMKALNRVISIGEEMGYEVEPVDNFNYVLDKSRDWQQQELGFTSVLLIVCMRRERFNTLEYLDDGTVLEQPLSSQAGIKERIACCLTGKNQSLDVLGLAVPKQRQADLYSVVPKVVRVTDDVCPRVKAINGPEIVGKEPKLDFLSNGMPVISIKYMKGIGGEYSKVSYGSKFANQSYNSNQAVCWSKETYITIVVPGYAVVESHCGPNVKPIMDRMDDTGNSPRAELSQAFRFGPEDSGKVYVFYFLKDREKRKAIERMYAPNHSDCRNCPEEKMSMSRGRNIYRGSAYRGNVRRLTERN